MGSDREVEDNWRRLKMIFAARGFAREAEDLAQEAFLRAITGEKYERFERPIQVLYGIASNLILEQARRRQLEQLAEDREPAAGDSPPPLTPPEDERMVCMRACNERMPPEQRALYEEYYEGLGQGEGSAKRIREEMQQRINISAGALRKRAYDIKQRYLACVEHCMRSRGRAAAGVPPVRIRLAAAKKG